MQKTAVPCSHQAVATHLSLVFFFFPCNTPQKRHFSNKCHCNTLGEKSKKLVPSEQLPFHTRISTLVFINWQLLIVASSK